MARILVVDDDPAIRDLLLATLGFAHEVVVAADGNEAVVQARRSPPEVVILDLDLPGFDGREILRRLLEADVRARVLVLTGSGRAREADLRAAGARDYLTKPFSPLDLIDRVERALVGGP